LRKPIHGSPSLIYPEQITLPPVQPVDLFQLLLQLQHTGTCIFILTLVSLTNVKS
jgi:hypothetical protein